MNPVDKFHEHLDGCSQCRNHPFDLCCIGRILLHAAGQYAANELAKMEVDDAEAGSRTD